MPPMLPPSTIQIKRKRTDDPVDLLHVQNEVGGDARPVKKFIFKRQRTSSTPATNASIQPISEAPDFIAIDPAAPVARNISGIPQVIATNPGDELRLRDSPVQARTNKATVPAPTLQQNDGSSSFSNNVATPQEPRRFHMTITKPSTINGRIKKKRRGDKPPVAVFIERREVPTTTTSIRSESPSRKPSSAWPNAAINPLKGLRPVTDGKKTPSGSIRLKGKSEQSTNLRSLQAFEQEERPIAANESTEENPLKAPQNTTLETSSNGTTASPIKASPYGRFKPRAPPRRTDRGPGIQHQTNNQIQLEAPAENATVTDNEDSIMKDFDDSDYVVDTYIRVPAPSPPPDPTSTSPTLIPDPQPSNPFSLSPDPPTSRIGLLILDTKQDYDTFYSFDPSSSAYHDPDASSPDSDNPYNDDDEDSNAESYVGNDYPDEGFEDEDDEAPYKYRTRNASDEEEWDVHDEEEEDEGLGDALRGMRLGGGNGSGGGRKKVPVWMRGTYSYRDRGQRGRGGEEDEDGDEEEESD